MENIESYLTIAAAFFIVTVSPGPANLALATVAMHSGRTAGLFFGLGLSAQAVAVATVICAVLGLMNYTGYALTFSLPGFMAAAVTRGCSHWRASA
jgi:threonine efflux protein